MTAYPSSPSATNTARFIVYVAGVLTVVMLLFPPFTGLNGTEYAFLFTGPTWSLQMGLLGENLGLTPHIHWMHLIVQLAVVWAIALGARKYLTAPPPTPMFSPLLLGSFVLLLVPGVSAQPLADVGSQARVLRSQTDASPAVYRPSAGAPINAAADTLDTRTVGLQGGRFGLGVTSSWPAYGLSGTLQFSETLTAEALLGFFGTISNFGGRVWYRFKRDLDYDLYGYGAASLYRYDYVIDTESVLGLGGGAGIEAGLQRLLDDSDFPPIFINAEVGLAIASFEYYNFSTFIFGAGIHYRFGN